RHAIEIVTQVQGARQVRSDPITLHHDIAVGDQDSTSVAGDDVAGAGGRAPDGDAVIASIALWRKEDAVSGVAQRGIAGRVHAEEIALYRHVGGIIETDFVGMNS